MSSIPPTPPASGTPVVWWKRRWLHVPILVWPLIVFFAIGFIGMAFGAGDDTDSSGTTLATVGTDAATTIAETSATSETVTTVAPATTTASTSPPTTIAATTSTAAATTVPAPAMPDISDDALEFMELDGCELQDDGWWRCTRDSAELFITEESDPVIAFEQVQAMPGYNEFAAVLFAVEGGGIVYLPTTIGWEMFDVAPWPDMSVIDTDCIGVPANPALCP